VDEPLTFAIALAVAVVATPVAGWVARRAGIVDRPGALKTHSTPVAYLGGVAVFLALLVGPLSAGRADLLLPLGAALLLGVVDDIHPLPSVVRLGAEICIGVLAAFVVPGPVLVQVGSGVLVVVLLNAVNLIDGQDGLAAGIGLVAALGAATLGGDATPVALAIAGGALGFLVYNRPPARIYLGDGGSYLLGTSLALLPSLAGADLHRWSVWFAVPLLFAMPLADTAIAVVRRLRAHHPLFVGDRSHVYDQLVDRGWSVTASTSLCIAAQLLLTAGGAVAAQLAPAWALVATLCGAAVVAAAAVAGGFTVAARPEGAR
jgi:UDP-GlcNAc:undecaprenyl-phosphate GlcNAc-1-phosphate transferase